MRRTLLYSLLAIAGLTAALGARQMPSSPVYAIRGARLVTAAGATIDKGRNVGRVGSTGRSTGPHIHYEVLHDNVVKNPNNFVEAGRNVL